ncbi:hypothetical protein PTKIN_Ptkin02bG0254400 [Pterospermum kingtungense]
MDGCGHFSIIERMLTACARAPIGPYIPPERLKFYLLVLQWVESFSNAGSFQIKQPNLFQGFKLHGLWGHHATGRPYKEPPSPSSPSNVSVLLLRSLRYLLRDLVRDWPNLKFGQSNYDFWNEQWQKHGFYYGFAPYHYFAMALDLYHALRLRDPMLGLRVGQGKSLWRTARDVRNCIGVFPEIHLNRDFQQRAQIYEIRIRFDKTLTHLEHRKLDQYGNRAPLFSGSTRGVDFNRTLVGLP